MTAVTAAMTPDLPTRNGWCGGHVVSGWHGGELWTGWQCDRCGVVRYYAPDAAFNRRGP